MENNDKIFETKLDFINQYREACLLELGKDFEECSDNERYFVLAKLVASKSRAIQATSHAKDAKKVYTQTTAAVLRMKDSTMETVSKVQEQAGDILADAKAINEARAAEAEAAVIEDAAEETTEETAE